ncbi:MAG: DUF167 domain-containing protein [Tepidiformaceae bacterium]
MARIQVRVTPRASRDSIELLPDGAIRVRVTAAPADGAANAAAARRLAKSLALPPRDVVLVSGATSREKVFDVPLDPAELRRRLQPKS